MAQTQDVADDADERIAFTKRLLLQLRSRYRGVAIDADPDTFAVRVVGAGVASTLPLSPLQQACRRDPGQESTLITAWVRSVDRQMTPGVKAAISLARLVWCVRSQRYLESVNRAADLIRRDVGADLVAFVAETLPGSVMRGIPLTDLDAAGHSAATARAAADANTANRFAAIPARIRGTDRVPSDGWRLSSDVLFQGSVVLVPDILAAFVERTGGEVLIGLPDRALVLVVAADGLNADRFAMRVLRQYREAMDPCSREVLISDGSSLRELRRRRPRRGLELLTWIRDSS